MLTLTEFSAWHSEESEVYHNNLKCTEGNNIEEINRIRGKGGRKHCLRCKELQAKA